MTNLPTTDTPVVAEVILSEDALSQVIGTPKRTLQRWRNTGDGPPFVRLGPRRVGYRPPDVERWLKARTFTSRAAELARQSPDNSAK
jgi:predicted DNA-binding transcriptional regulator AlpA